MINFFLQLNIHSGMTEGQKVMFHGEGDQEPDLEPGDVVIVLVEKEHSIYHRCVLFLNFFFMWRFH